MMQKYVFLLMVSVLAVIMVSTVPVYANAITEIKVLGFADITTSSDSDGIPAFDDNVQTSYDPVANENGHWLAIDFYEPVTFNKVGIYPILTTGLYINKIAKIKLQYSDDKVTWTTLCMADNMMDVAYKADFPEVTTKYVRLLTQNDEIHNVRIAEIKLFYNETVTQQREPRIYYVSVGGDDNADGSKEAPFATIQNAADIMQAGDVCLIREGEYFEEVLCTKSGTEDQPITFMAYPGEKVMLKGTDVLDARWEPHSQSVYKTPFDKYTTQFFYDNKAMVIAMWPNLPNHDFLGKSNFARATEGDYDFFETRGIPSGDIDGAKIRFSPGLEWYGWEKEIYRDRNNENRLMFENPLPSGNAGTALVGEDPTKPKAGNMLYMFGKLALLDAVGEWVIDEGYLYVNTGGDPASQVLEYRARDFGFKLCGAQNIQIKNIEFFAAGLLMLGTSNCVIDNCKFTYTDYDDMMFIFKDDPDWEAKSNYGRLTRLKKRTGVMISGEKNIIKNSLVAYCYQNGISLYGNMNVVLNNIIHDVCLYADYYAAVTTNGVGNQIVGNTLYRSGRFLIQHGNSKGLHISRNHMYDYGFLTLDLGATYVYNNDGQGTVISYNVVHNENNPHGERGIYIDNYCRNHTIHNNVIYNVSQAFPLNSPSISNVLRNNTCFNVASFSRTYAHIGVAQMMYDNKIYQNLYTGAFSYASGVNSAPEVRNNIETEIDPKTFLPVNEAIDTQVYGAVTRGVEFKYGADWNASEKGW